MLSQAFGAAPVAPADKAPAGKEQTGDIVATSFETLMAPQEGAARFIANDSDNSIVISASPTQYREALRLLAALDKPPVQVLIDVTLVEVNLNESTKFGVEAYLQGFGGKLSLGGGATPANAGAASGFNLVFGEQDSPKFVIDALSRVTDVRVISAPSVVAFESEEAEIKVVEQVPIITQQVVRTEAGNAPVVNSIEYRDAGVILRVTPSTADSDLVNLNVQQELSAVVGETENGATLTPTLRQRSISTRVSVYDGQTVVLGGLIAAQSAKDRKGLPIFDFLDTSRLDGQARTELIVFITPHVVRDARDAESVSRELRSRMAALGE